MVEVNERVSEVKAVLEVNKIEEVISQNEIKLNRSRELMKVKYPKIDFIETLKGIKQFTDNPRCISCKHYYEQSKISEIKAKMRGDKGVFPFFMLRIYKNNGEKFKDAKGYCCSSITPMGDKMAKLRLPVPSMSLCSSYYIDPDIRSYFRTLSRKLNELDALERKLIDTKKIDLLKKEQARKLIESIDKKYEIKSESREKELSIVK